MAKLPYVPDGDYLPHDLLCHAFISMAVTFGKSREFYSPLAWPYLGVLEKFNIPDHVIWEELETLAGIPLFPRPFTPLSTLPQHALLPGGASTW